MKLNIFNNKSNNLKLVEEFIINSVIESGALSNKIYVDVKEGFGSSETESFTATAVVTDGN